MNQSRRNFLKTASYAGATVAALSAGVLTPMRVLAAMDRTAFLATDMNTAMNESMGSDQHSASDQIKMKAPDIAENGAVVPITVEASMANVDSIGIYIAGNNAPLASTYKLSAGTEAFVSTRVKMAKTSDVIAVVKADGKLYSTTKEVKVTIGGCGG